jgi:tRNA U54 and U55 pseudouridine synthase Pus10
MSELVSELGKEASQGARLARENIVELVRKLIMKRLVIGEQINQPISALGAEIVKNLGGGLGEEVCWEFVRDLRKELAKTLTEKSAKRSSESSAVEERCG